jgi:hypothetical protein
MRKKGFTEYRSSLSSDVIDRIDEALSDPRYEDIFEALSKIPYVDGVLPERKFSHKRRGPGVYLRSIVGGCAFVAIYARDQSGYLATVFLENIDRAEEFATHLTRVKDILN